MPNDDVMDFIESLGNQKLEALADFLTDYEMLKGWNKLTQKEIAQKAGTTQSAISRLERMKGKPAYDLLHRVSEAVDGSLLITPMGDMTLTLPYDLQNKAKEKADLEGQTVQEWMRSVLRDNLENTESGKEIFKPQRVISSVLNPTYGKNEEVTIDYNPTESVAV